MVGLISNVDLLQYVTQNDATPDIRNDEDLPTKKSTADSSNDILSDELNNMTLKI